MWKSTDNKLSENQKIREVILYLLFGFLTTAFSLLLYCFFTRVMGLEYYTSNVISWFSAVSFAFITNKKIVFLDSGRLISKAIGFFGVRLASLGLECVFLYVGIELLHIDDFIVKLIVQVIVVVTNYFTGNMLVFKKESVSKQKISEDKMGEDYSK